MLSSTRYLYTDNISTTYSTTALQQYNGNTVSRANITQCGDAAIPIGPRLRAGCSTVLVADCCTTAEYSSSSNPPHHSSCLRSAVHALNQLLFSTSKMFRPNHSCSRSSRRSSRSRNISNRNAFLRQALRCALYWLLECQSTV